MKRRGATTWPEYVVVLSIILILGAILYPVFSRARMNAYRSSCQVNQKQIALALFQYTADNKGDLPGRDWVALAKPYVKDSAIFRCPSKASPTGASDYFFNVRFLKKHLEDIKSPQTLVLMGDGRDDSPLLRLPSVWLTDPNSPALRHLDGANYCFADGHVKWFKPKYISGDFRYRFVY